MNNLLKLTRVFVGLSNWTFVFFVGTWTDDVVRDRLKLLEIVLTK
jgi:hypothetical protein